MHLVGENRGLRTDPWETTSVRSPGKEEEPAKEIREGMADEIGGKPGKECPESQMMRVY